MPCEAGGLVSDSLSGIAGVSAGLAARGGSLGRVNGPIWPQPAITRAISVAGNRAGFIREESRICLSASRGPSTMAVQFNEPA